MPTLHVHLSPDASLSWLIYLLLAFMLVVIVAGAIASRQAPVEPPPDDEERQVSAHAETQAPVRSPRAPRRK